MSRWAKFKWWMTQSPVAFRVTVTYQYALLYRRGEWILINGRLRRIVGADPVREIWWVV